MAAFIFGDLLILPILNIYRKYYGVKATLFLAAAFYASMMSAALVLEAAFQILHLVPHQRIATVTSTGIRFNYTSVLDLVAVLTTMGLLVVFVRTDGLAMLRSMKDGQHGGNMHGGSHHNHD